MNRLSALVLITLLVAIFIHAEEEKPNVALIEKVSLNLLNTHVPAPSKKGAIIELPNGTKIQYGSLFDLELMALVAFFPRPTNDGEFDYPPCHLSLLEWSGSRWLFRQFLGSASKFDIHERKDLKLIIVQGWCRTERNGGEQSSWKWEPKSRKLVQTGLDDWGPFCLKGEFICYTRGTERLAHWDTRWIYRFKDGKRGDLVACFHEVDDGRWTVSFLAKPGPKELTRWSFIPSLDAPWMISLHSASREDEQGGREIAQLLLPKDHELSQHFCFEWLTGLSAKLLDDEWLETVPKPQIKIRPKIDVTGDTEVISRFQWPISR